MNAVCWWERSCPWAESSGVQREYSSYGYDPNICSKQWFCMVNISTFHIAWHYLTIGILVV